MRYVISVVTLLFFVSLIPINAQEHHTARPDTWQGLTLDVSTPEDAIRILGKPAKDKTDKLQIVWVDKWISEKHKQKIFRKLEFKKPEGFNKAELSFLDGKLAMIDLEAKDPEEHADWVDPDHLASLFGVEFAAVNWGWRVKLPPLQEFQNIKEPRLPKEVAEVYHMITVSGQSIISARVNNIKALPFGIFTRGNSGNARERNKEKEKRDAAGTYPGAVWSIQVISRTLEIQQATKVLE